MPRCTALVQFPRLAGTLQGQVVDGTVLQAHIAAHAQDAPQSRSAEQDLPCLRAPLRVAQEVGAGLGRGALLLGALPPQRQDR
jgi:hypothetical protein